jgi:hypothetical protein
MTATGACHPHAPRRDETGSQGEIGAPRGDLLQAVNIAIVMQSTLIMSELAQRRCRSERQGEDLRRGGKRRLTTLPGLPDKRTCTGLWRHAKGISAFWIKRSRIHSEASKRDAENVFRSLTSMGISADRVSLSATTNAIANSDEVRLYVR